MLSPFGGAGGGSICDDQTTLEPGRVRAPTVAIGTNKRPNFTVLEIAAPIQLCLWRFAEGRPIQVEVRYPDGRVAKLTGFPPGSRPCGVLCYSHVNWAAVAGDPLGDYKVTAVQRQLRAVATIRVVRSTERRILVVGNGVDEQERGCRSAPMPRAGPSTTSTRRPVTLQGATSSIPAPHPRRRGEAQLVTWWCSRTPRRCSA
jgi:hypothetical protein